MPAAEWRGWIIELLIEALAYFGADHVEDRFGKIVAYLYVIAAIFGRIALAGLIVWLSLPHLL